MHGFRCKPLIFGLSFLLLIFEISGTPYDLNEANWKLMLKDEWMVQFVAPWCPSCKAVEPVWKRFASTADKLKIKVATVDITKSPLLSGRFFVTSLPTIYHVIDGKFRCYNGKRDLYALTDFVKLKQWENIVPVSKWNSPDAYHMDILSYFFRVSLVLKAWNTQLQEEFGLSAYCSSAIFIFGTTLIGGIFGYFLLKLLEFVYPSKNFDIKANPLLDVDQKNESRKTAKRDFKNCAERENKDPMESSFEDNDEYESDHFADPNMNYSSEREINETFSLYDDNTGSTNS